MQSTHISENAQNAATESDENRSSSKLDNTNERDAIVCESIRKACSQIGYDFKGTSEAGCTVNTLLLQWDDKDHKPAGTVKCPVRAFCANVGDSRCVMLRSYETKHALVTSACFGAHSQSSPELSSIDRSLSAHSEPTLETPPSGSPKHKALSGAFHSVQSLSHLAPIHHSSSSSTSNRFVAVHLMSEDHKLSLHRERLRIINAAEGKLPAGNETEYWHTLPADASAIYLPQYAKTLPPVTFSGLPECGLLAGEGDVGEEPASSGPFGRRSSPFSSSSSHGRLSSTGDSFSLDVDASSRSTHGLGLGYSTHSVSQSMSQSMHSTGTSFHGGSTHATSTTRSVLNKYFIFDWGYPSIDAQSAASRFISAITDSSPASPARGVSNRTSELDLQARAAPDDPNDPPLAYKLSFIKKRSNRSGVATGPEALFSRHNTSIMMTRSMG